MNNRISAISDRMRSICRERETSVFAAAAVANTWEWNVHMNFFLQCVGVGVGELVSRDLVVLFLPIALYIVFFIRPRESCADCHDSLTEWVHVALLSSLNLDWSNWLRSICPFFSSQEHLSPHSHSQSHSFHKLTHESYCHVVNCLYPFFSLSSELSSTTTSSSLIVVT